MNKKVNYRNSEECRNLTYKHMKDMTLEDAIFIVSEPVRKYHEAKDDKERMYLPRAKLIRAYELLIEAAEELQRIKIHKGSDKK